MPTPQDNLQFIYRKSFETYKAFESSNSPVKRYIFNAVEKLFKTTSAIRLLYVNLEDFREFEFAIGILIRSICMDCLQVLYLRHLVFSNEDHLEEAKKQVNSQCEIFLNDGTEFMINGIVQHTAFTDEQKEGIIKKMLDMFPNTIDFKDNIAKKKKDYQFKLDNLYKGSNHPSLFNKDHIYEIYSYYSKYDHLSHWTAMSSLFNFNSLKKRVDDAFLVLLFHLRDLISIAYDFDDTCKHLLRYSDEIHNYIDEVMTQYTSQAALRMSI